MHHQSPSSPGKPLTGYAAWLEKGTVAIFLFHGVIPANRHRVRNYTRKHLAVDQFVEILDALCASGTPVSMDEIAAATAHNPLPPRAFAITFDDGFANNYSIARPLLRARRVPAMFYVTSGFIEANESSWIDKIEYAFEKCPRARLDLPALGVTGRDAATDDAKRELLDELRRVVKADPAIDPYSIASDVWAQLGIDRMDPDPYLDQKMTWQQVREITVDQLFAVGGHGRTHRVLEFLSDDDLESEVKASIAALSANIGQAVTHYSYPEGLSHCYSDRVIGVLKRHGIVCAPTAEPGVNRAGDDLFRLRRIMVS